MRKLIFNLHLYIALVAGLFVITLGLTGAIMAFESDLDHVLRPSLSYVTPHDHRLTLAELADAVAKAFPGERATGFQVSPAPNISAGVSTKRGLIMVDPYTGAILGIRPGG